MYQTPTHWLPEDQTSEQERDRGRNFITSEVQGWWEAKAPAVFTSRKGWREGVVEIFVHYLVLLCSLCENLLQVPLLATDYLISFCDGGWSQLLKDAFSCVQCTAQCTDKAPSHSGSTTSFCLLLIFCLLFCSFLGIPGHRLLLFSFFFFFFNTTVIDSSAHIQSCWVSSNIGYMTWVFS